MLSRTLHNLRDYYWHGPPLRLSGDGTRHHWHRPGTVMSELTCQCLRLRYGHSESVLPQNFSLLDSHASSLRPDSASERLQVRFCPLLSPFRPGRGSRGAVERTSSSSWSLERRKAVSLQAQARVFSRKEGFEAKELKIKAGLDSVRFGSNEVQSAKYEIQNRLRQNRRLRLRNPDAKRDRGTLTGPGMGADWFARMAT